MTTPREAPGVLTWLTLARTRRLVRRPIHRILALSVGIVYALVAMLVGGMLTIFSPPAHVSSYWILIPSGQPWWDYPAALVVNPAFVLALPFLGTLLMVVTSVGVALGMTVAVVLGVRLARQRKTRAGSSAAASTAAGFTPAMIALVTLGACCSTTAAATAGIGLAAQATGTSYQAVLNNTWYIAMFQAGILYVALLAQEQLLAVYGFLFGAGPGDAEAAALRPPPVDRRFLAGAALRVALLAAAVTWSLAMFAAWTTVGPATASAALWVSWLFQHQLVAVVAGLAALFPVGTLAALGRPGRRLESRLLRAVLLVTGLTLLLWVPPPLSGAGLHGLVNELFGAVGLPAAWGAVAPPVAIGLGVALRWVLQFGLLGLFSLAVGYSPERAFRPILWAVARREPARDAGPVGPEPGRAARPADAVRPDATRAAES